jgi:hypothetical protein
MMAVDNSKANIGGGYRIESLRGAENYVLWKIRMEDILVDMGLWEYVSGEKEKPADNAKDQLQIWKTMDRKALTQIRMRITESMFAYVMSSKTSKDAWDAFKTVFEVSRSLVVVIIWRKLFRYRIKEGSNMEKQVYILRSYREQLISLDCAVSSKDFALALLTALPDSWDTFVRALNTSDLKINKLVCRILAEDKYRRHVPTWRLLS